VVYDDHARRFLLRAKNGHRVEILSPLATQLALVVSTSGIANGVDAVVAVPSTRLARWRRGFNPATVLAAELARCSRKRILPGALRKRRFGGAPLKARGAAARWAEAGGSISCELGLAGARILLVDDVLTTGATVVACANALRANGTEEVRVAVWARTLLTGSGFDRLGEAPYNPFPPG
jgi:predicted amidophosphoribosyltransferase